LTKNRILELLFLSTCILVRAPLFMPLNIYPDEHTFLNMGHDVAQGNLPYQHLWDNKPPLLFFLLAPLTSLSFHNMLVPRLAAAMLDGIVALLVKRIADRLFGERSTHWIASLWCFAATTLSVGGGALMSETVALPFLMSAALILATERNSTTESAFSGVLLGSAALVRFTPVLPAVAIVAWLAVSGLIRRDFAQMRSAVFVVAGGLLILIIVVLPFALVGDLDVLWRSTVLAPLAYVGGESRSILKLFLEDLSSMKMTAFTIIAGIVGLASSFSTYRKVEKFQRLAVMYMAAIVALFFGAAWQHYFVTIVPLSAVFAAPVLSRVITIPKQQLSRWAVLIILAVPMAAAAGKAVKRSLLPDTMANTRTFLKTRMLPGDTLYLTVDYGLYWLLERSPPHPIVTHAGNLFRPDMFRVLPYGMSSAADVMEAIVQERPTWIVFGDETQWKYGPETEVGKVLQPVLARDYTLEPSPADRAIYRLRDRR
jgi:Dolichyl-phosphate-mannose-protein mannosyltransferase